MPDEEGVVGFKIPKTGASSDDGGDPDGRLQEDPAGLVAGIEGEKKKPEDGGEHLGDGFVFADIFGGKNNPLLAGDETYAGDEELAGHDEGDEPDGKEPGAEQADKGHDDEELVGEGIEKTAEVGFDLPFAGEMTVQPVGESRGHEEGESEPGGPERDRGVSASLEKDEQDKGGGDTGEGKPVGNSHFVSLS